MLKISIVDTQKQRRLIVEGALIAAWAAELANVYARSRAALNGRELLIELRDLTAINEEGEVVLLGLMNEGVKIRYRGLFAKHVLTEIARQRHTDDIKQRNTGREIEIV